MSAQRAVLRRAGLIANVGRSFAAASLILLGAGCTILLEETPPPESPPQVEDLAPLTCAGPDRHSLRAMPVALDARCSRRLDAEAQLTMVWRQVTGARVTLQSAVGEEASFLAPFTAGALDFRLESQRDGVSGADRTSVTVGERVEAIAPLAIALGDLVSEGGAVHLDGSDSRAVGDMITAYRWRQVGGPYADIEDPTAPATSVTLSPGTTTAAFALEVMGAEGLWSEPEFVVVRDAEEVQAPLASPSFSAPTYALPGEPVELGTPTRDSAGGVTYLVRQLRGDRVNLDLSDPTRVRFTAPRAPQVLAFRLDAEISGVRAPPAVAVITVTGGVGNLAPVADAGPDRTVRPGQRLSLNAAASWDPDGDEISGFTWKQTAGPDLALDCDAQSCVVDLPEFACQIGIVLVVGDRVAESAPDVVVISVDPDASNQPPRADAGGERWALPGSAVVLDGSASDDPDSGSISSFLWRQIDDGAPRAVLGDATGPSLTLAAPAQIAALVFELEVCDGDEVCATDTATLYLADAGPYVDGELGTDDGDGTANAPLRTVAQGLAQIDRYRFNELRVAAHRYQEVTPLQVAPGVRVEGGLVRAGGTYVDSVSAETVIVVPGVDGLNIGNGASLERLTVESALATATIPQRRLVVLGTQTRLSDVRVIGPTHAEQTVGIELVEGSRAELANVSIGGGVGVTETTALRSAPSTVLLTDGIDVELGSAPRVVGVSTTHGQITLVDARVTTAAESVADELVGLDLIWADALVSATMVHLDAPTQSLAPRSGIGLRCHKCSLEMDSACEVRGPRGVLDGGDGVGVKLYLPLVATVAGTILGGAASPGARLTAVDLFGGRLTLREATLRATEAGEARSAAGLVVDGAVVDAEATSIEAHAETTAVGVQLTLSDSAELTLTGLDVRAARALGVGDGVFWEEGTDLPASALLALSLAGPTTVDGETETIGVALRGTTSGTLEIDELTATGGSISRALTLDQVGEITVIGSNLVARTTSGAGEAAALTCAGAEGAEPDIGLLRSRLGAEGDLAVALDVGTCSMSAAAVVLRADASSTAHAAQCAGTLSLNGAYLTARAPSGTAISIGPGGSAALINSVVAVPAPAQASLRSAESVDQWLALHHVLFAPRGAPLLEVATELVAEDGQELASLRPRFSDLFVTDDPAIDDTGHITSGESPAVDTADPLSVTLVDIDGEARPRGAGPDIGPDEL